MGTARTRLILVCAAIALLLAPTAVSQGGDHASPNLSKYNELFDQLTVLAIAIGALVWILIIVALVRFRRNRAGEPPVDEGHRGNKSLEIVWTIIPTIIVIWMAFVSIDALNAVEEPPADPEVVVDVIAQQWKWQYNYTNGWTDFDDMWLAKGALVRFNITALDVQHALSIPGLGVIRDAYPGRVNHFWVRADEVGEWKPWMEGCGLVSSTTEDNRTVTTATCAPAPEDNFTAFKKGQVGEYRLQCQQYCGGAHAHMVGKTVIFDAALHPGKLKYGNFTIERLTERPEADVYFELNLEEHRGPPLFKQWSIDPPEIRVSLGDVVAIRVWNNETVTHNLQIGGEYDVKSADVPVGGFAWFTFTADKATSGTPYWCDVPGHRQAGMEGTLVVA